MQCGKERKKNAKKINIKKLYIMYDDVLNNLKNVRKIIQINITYFFNIIY